MDDCTNGCWDISSWSWHCQALWPLKRVAPIEEDILRGATMTVEFCTSLGRTSIMVVRAHVLSWYKCEFETCTVFLQLLLPFPFQASMLQKLSLHAKAGRYSCRYRQYRYSPCIVYRLGKLNIVSCISKCHQLTLADHNQNKTKNWTKLGKPGLLCFLFFFIVTSQWVLSRTSFLTKCDTRHVFLYTFKVTWY